MDGDPHGDQQRDASGDVGRAVDRGGGGSADVHLVRRAAGHGRDHVLTQRADQVLGGGVLRPSGRDHREQGGVTGRVQLRRLHRRHARRAAERTDQAVHQSLIGTGRQVRDDDQRAVRAGPETPGQHVVRLPGGPACRIVAGVGEPEPYTEEGCREHEQHTGADQRRGQAVPVDEPAPARPAGRGHDVPAGDGLHLTAPPQRDVQPVDPPADVAEQGGQERHRGCHHDEDRHDRHEGGAAHERQTHREQAEHAHHDGAAGDQDRAAGGVKRRDGGGLRVKARLPPLLEAGDHEQHVVDADADAHHRSERGRPVRHVDHGGHQADERAADHQAGHGDQDRQPGRDDGAEGQQQDDRRGRDADALGADRTLLGSFDRLAAERDVEPGPFGGLRGPEQLLRVGDRHVHGLATSSGGRRGLAVPEMSPGVVYGSSTAATCGIPPSSRRGPSSSGRPGREPGRTTTKPCPPPAPGSAGQAAPGPLGVRPRHRVSAVNAGEGGGARSPGQSASQPSMTRPRQWAHGQAQRASLAGWSNDRRWSARPGRVLALVRCRVRAARGWGWWP
jgi:hypothetical protein